MQHRSAMQNTLPIYLGMTGCGEGRHNICRGPGRYIASGSGPQPSSTQPIQCRDSSEVCYKQAVGCKMPLRLVTAITQHMLCISDDNKQLS